MRFNPLFPTIGTELTGVTFNDILSDALFPELDHALRQHQLLVIRGLQLTPEQQLLLARKFGHPIPFVMSRYHHPDHPELMISSNEVKDGKPLGVARVGNFWHQDSSFTQDPAAYTMLYGINIPPRSGDTLFASAIDLYRRLPEEWKRRIAGLQARHTVSKRFRIRAEHVGLSIAELNEVIAQEHPTVLHPLVQIDQDSGQPYLYASKEYVDEVLGLDRASSDEFLDLIDRLTQDPAHVYVHRWQPGDLLIWKTRTALHAATAVEPGLRRTVHRASIEAPV
ncbi:TauD/TfdA family dioxygenase [Chromobacterium violaceum]|uniref:TauD/TfdA dioxygenase family protein n=1 Tax=Chromobacterium violaceum TaxID=536 RepID=UPI001E5F33A1|nr:TauD/TfdA family dioxygenase [Chromobacterium violaceum]MCD0494891.1 TauD/TfdA family dioxygenase [Chromobacterium violaceum]